MENENMEKIMLCFLKKEFLNIFLKNTCSNAISVIPTLKDLKVVNKDIRPEFIKPIYSVEF